MKILRKIIVVLCTMVVTGAFAKDDDIPKQITIGLIATTTAEDTQKRWQPVIDDFAKYTKMEVHIVASTDYNKIVSGLKSNTIQVAWLGNKAALDAVEDQHATIFAQFVKKEGSRGYNSVLITPANSPVKSLTDILTNKGVYSFYDGDKGSTSGYLVPAYYAFAKNKVEPEKLFKKITAGNHKKNLQAVIDGQVDVATNNTEELDRLKKEAPEQFNKVRVIWTSPLISNDPLLYRKDLPVATKNKIEEFFVTYGKPKNPASQPDVLQNILDLSGFQHSTDAQLKPTADLTMFGLLRSNMYDASLSTAQKQKAFEDITARFGKLSVTLEMARLR
ncbi:phosphonate transport system substrate-binding protein [Collimonas sp. OK607]|uniref:phosphate/phosphite/phosphonate ABC transporter substrate-binding protein n=1 Tax=Collimonas sp. OK607 TaxID=1798194 RepID=UPI0008ECA665|nr:phosphate/phosphite/phosphonate ABC transporter substrate-binding protein [Collimonas sp. OK607]SFB38955.1 phosphonate transport system substrate-binding protein [Collimonas sp. OK607]